MCYYGSDVASSHSMSRPQQCLIGYSAVEWKCKVAEKRKYSSKVAHNCTANVLVPNISELSLGFLIISFGIGPEKINVDRPPVLDPPLMLGSR